MNILIYGYGEIGKGLYELCLMLKLHVKVVDDCIPLALVGSKSCISLSALDAGDIDKAFVCNHNAQIAKKMQDRLLKIGIDKQKIKIFNEVFYKRSFKKILKKSFNHTQDIANELLNNTDDFIESMKKVKQEYFKFKDKQNLRDAKRLREFDALGLNAFATMYATKALSNDINCILYPGFSVGCSGGKDLEFHFMDKIDFLALSKRPKDLKLVACFGDSCMQGDYLQENHRLTYLLQKRLGEGYKVLNFGISGFSQYEQMMLYNALVYPLKPEIVISLFMGWDFFNYVSCDRLAKEHKILYNPFYSEIPYRQLTHSKRPIPYKMQYTKAFYRQKERDNLEATVVRLEQFRNIVESAGGGAFIAIMRAFLWLQKEWQVKKGYDKDSFIQRHVEKFYQAKKAFSSYPYVYDINDIMPKNSASLYCDGCHFNELGNNLVSDWIYEILRRKKLVC